MTAQQSDSRQQDIDVLVQPNLGARRNTLPALDSSRDFHLIGVAKGNVQLRRKDIDAICRKQAAWAPAEDNLYRKFPGYEGEARIEEFDAALR